jgi:hypothetical protein
MTVAVVFPLSVWSYHMDMFIERNAKVYIAPSDRKKALKKHQGMVVSGYWGALLR